MGKLSKLLLPTLGRVRRRARTASGGRCIDQYYGGELLRVEICVGLKSTTDTLGYVPSDVDRPIHERALGMNV